MVLDVPQINLLHYQSFFNENTSLKLLQYLQQSFITFDCAQYLFFYSFFFMLPSPNGPGSCMTQYCLYFMEHTKRIQYNIIFYMTWIQHYNIFSCSISIRAWLIVCSTYYSILYCCLRGSTWYVPKSKLHSIRITPPHSTRNE